MSIKPLKKESGHQLKDRFILFALVGIIAAIVIPQSGFSSINPGLQFAIVFIVGLILGTLAGRRRATSGFVVFSLLFLPLVMWLSVWLLYPMFSMGERRGYGIKVRLDLEDAAHAQESYFAKNNSYKACVACTSKDLPEFYPYPNVTLNIETGSTSFTLTATHENCKGEWTYQSTTGEITGPDAIDSCKWP